mmetsp:Transcript_15999/g.37430  ORF Transcript_15999/g.37430 Transcript_15999/m.37430 type:complete len:310 (-) Transcript_15999:1071-2000(-)
MSELLRPELHALVGRQRIEVRRNKGGILGSHSFLANGPCYPRQRVHLKLLAELLQPLSRVPLCTPAQLLLIEAEVVSSQLVDLPKCEILHLRYFLMLQGPRNGLFHPNNLPREAAVALLTRPLPATWDRPCPPHCCGGALAARSQRLQAVHVARAAHESQVTMQNVMANDPLGQPEHAAPHCGERFCDSLPVAPGHANASAMKPRLFASGREAISTAQGRWCFHSRLRVGLCPVTSFLLLEALSALPLEDLRSTPIFLHAPLLEPRSAPDRDGTEGRLHCLAEAVLKELVFQAAEKPCVRVPDAYLVRP